MRVIAAHHVAHDLGGLLERRRGVEPQQLHHVQQAAVNRLQAIAHIGQRPVHDGGQGIGEVALFQRILQLDADDTLRPLEGRNVLAHDSRFIAFPPSPWWRRAALNLHDVNLDDGLLAPGLVRRAAH